MQEGLGNKTGHQCCSKRKVKRGLWSPDEDEKLIKYITTHGHGSWSSVPKLAGTDHTHTLWCSLIDPFICFSFMKKWSLILVLSKPNPPVVLFLFLLMEASSFRAAKVWKEL